MEAMRSPKFHDLATPIKDQKVSQRARPPLPPPLPLSAPSPTTGAGPMAVAVGTDNGESRGAINFDSDSEDIEVDDSPRLPADWLPFEYELLEYADSLPVGFVEGVGRMLEAQQRRVAQLRSLNTLMLDVLRCEDFDSLNLEAAAESAASLDKAIQEVRRRAEAAKQLREQEEELEAVSLENAPRQSGNNNFSWKDPEDDSSPPEALSSPQFVAKIADDLVKDLKTQTKSAILGSPDVKNIAGRIMAMAASPPTSPSRDLGPRSPTRSPRKKDIKLTPTTGTAASLWCSKEEVARRLESSSRARKLEQQVLEVRRAAEKELLDLASRARLAEEKQRKLSRESAGDDAASRKRLYEADAKLQRLRNRVQQLQLTKRNAERRRHNGESQDRQALTTLHDLEQEVIGYRIQAKEFDELEMQEEDLRRLLRSKKSELRSYTTREKAAAAMTAIESAEKANRACHRPILGSDFSSSAPRSPRGGGWSPSASVSGRGQTPIRITGFCPSRRV
eukprot:TRINITY_DN11809_c1_g1_i1.p1 TRINITY_DN11809_c1_g1~~TRINITY_DN11809_c1_g1_i1.p1  ORF type:complete len:506 (-),score=132.05 TRINITY_DN11809_c1_g1_i1:139-1656(-)